MFSHPIPQALGPLLVLLYLSSPALAWDHLDRKHPTHRTLSTFRWTRPFLDLELKAENPHADPKDLDRDIPGGFHVYCEATKTFAARQLTAADLHKPPPDGLEPWAAALDVALHQRVYPGGWDGEELIGDGMQVLVMEYSDVPPTVRRFVEQEGVDAHTAKRWQFGVYDKPGRAGKQRRVAFGEGSSYVEDRPTAPQDKVMIFAPGALYDILPLWVADDSACKSMLRPHCHIRAKSTSTGRAGQPLETNGKPNRAIPRSGQVRQARRAQPRHRLAHDAHRARPGPWRQEDHLLPDQGQSAAGDGARAATQGGVEKCAPAG